MALTPHQANLPTPVGEGAARQLLFGSPTPVKPASPAPIVANVQVEAGEYEPAATAPQQHQDQPPAQDEDLALARLLQEQERIAFLMATGYGGDEQEEVRVEDDAAGEEGGELDDEALARRLQAEEVEATYRALMQNAMQGLEEEEEEQEEDHLQQLGYEGLTALGDMVGKVSKGLPEAIIAALPLSTFSSVKATGACTLDKCCICQLEYEEEEEVMVLPCQHCYHTGCIKTWLGMNKVCCVCNKEVEFSAGAQPDA